MNLDELKNKIAEQDGLKVCPVCGLPFKPYRKSQKTCAEPVCQKQYHKEYVRECNRRRRIENPEVVREYNKRKMRQYRQRQRDDEEFGKHANREIKRLQRQDEFSEKIRDYGDRYGEVQAQKTLASLPKIDVSLGGDKDDSVSD